MRLASCTFEIKSQIMHQIFDENALQAALRPTHIHRIDTLPASMQSESTTSATPCWATEGCK